MEMEKVLKIMNEFTNAKTAKRIHSPLHPEDRLYGTVTKEFYAEKSMELIDRLGTGKEPRWASIMPSEGPESKTFVSTIYAIPLLPGCETRAYVTSISTSCTFLYHNIMHPFQMAMLAWAGIASRASSLRSCSAPLTRSLSPG